MNKKGQLGPQALEDIPMGIMAFLVAIGAVIVVISLVSGYLTESGTYGMHKAGKRLAESFSGELFKSEISRSYGPSVLDQNLIEKYHLEDPSLQDEIGHIEYLFWSKITLDDDSWEFGTEPPKTALSYSLPVSVLSKDSIEDGKIIVKIWKK